MRRIPEGDWREAVHACEFGGKNAAQEHDQIVVHDNPSGVRTQISTRITERHQAPAARTQGGLSCIAQDARDRAGGPCCEATLDQSLAHRRMQLAGMTQSEGLEKLELVPG